MTCLIDGWADGAWEIEDELWGIVFGAFFFLEAGEGAEEKAADIGKDGGAARGYAVLREEGVELPEGVVDAGGCLEFLTLVGEDGEDVAVDGIAL